MTKEGRRYPPIRPWLYNPLIKVIRILAGLLARVHIVGQENIPAEGAVLIVSNHLHHLDSPVIGISLPRRTYVLAAEKYENHFPFGLILRTAGAIFIRRGEVDRVALRKAMNVLEDEYCLAVAVEGTRSKTGALAEGKTGAAYLATRLNVPLVPVVVWGTEEVIPSCLHLGRADVHVRFGEPFHLPEGRARSEQLKEYTEDIMLTLASMLPEQYRGVYQDHPQLTQELAAQQAEG